MAGTSSRGRGHRPVVEKRARPAAATAGDRPQVEVWSRILARRIQGRLGEPVVLAITDNIHTMVSYARRDGEVSLRLHHMFLSAPPKVVDALTGYLDGDPRASRTVDDFIEAHRYLVRRVPPRVRQRRLRIEPRGHRYDLQRIFDDLNRRYFRGEVKATVTWATAPRIRGPRGSIKLGSYSEETRIIRIHPALDHPVVPRYFAEYVVFHEMLHVVEGARPGLGRRQVHTPAFLRRERAFSHLARAQAWERRHLDWLLAWQPPPR